MKASMQLRTSQLLAMTPQLQQAIRFLQLSTLELQQEIQQAIETNPLLEIEEDLINPNESPDVLNSSESLDINAQSIPTDTVVDNQTTDHIEAPLQTDSEWVETIPVELNTDSNWDDTYQSSTTPVTNHAASNDYQLDNLHAYHDSLQDHLIWQLNLTSMSDIDRFIATSVIDAIDEKGYLTLTPTDIHTSTRSQLKLAGVDYSLEKSEVMAVVHRVQQFDPAGVGAQNLSECLAIQLGQLPEQTHWRTEATLLVKQYLPLLASRDFVNLSKCMDLKDTQLSQVIALITSLQPEPGACFNNNTTTYVVPDVIVEKHQGAWKVKLNEQATPNIHINKHYAELSNSTTGQDRQFIKDNLQDAKWFLKSLENRHSTLLRVTMRICEIQQQFLEVGEEAMQPLVLSEIADDLEMHESTISRITTQKYIHTPRGLFELKYFFSSHVQTKSGGEASSTAIRAMIKKLIATEPTKKPLSDNKLTKLLEEEDIQVARRTVAKYRESMNIPPSNERKSLI